MATAATLSYAERDNIIQAWSSPNGPSDEEKIKFADAALEQLNDSDMVAKFQENVKQVGTWANEVDAAFDRVSRSFADMVKKYGSDFPGFPNYETEWKGYKARWIQYLQDSRDVASSHVTILRRFDKVFLDMVESIQTEQDRKDVIVELQQFIDEDHQDSVTMSNNFLNLKRDIEDFVKRLDQFIVDTGAKLEEDATRLKNEIDGLNAAISTLDKQIKDSTIALAACGAALNIIGMAVAGGLLAKYQKERSEKAQELAKKQSELKDVNRKQQALAELKSDFDGVKPDIALICERLSLFAEIWSSVRSQSVQFQEQLKGGMGAVTNLRFKKEVRLARAVCKPLMDGLEKYASEIENRGK